MNFCALLLIRELFKNWNDSGVNTCSYVGCFLGQCGQRDMVRARRIPLPLPPTPHPGRIWLHRDNYINLLHICAANCKSKKKKQSWKRKQGWKWRLYTNILSHFYLSFVFGLYFVNSKSDYILNTEWHDLFDDQRLKTNMWNVVLFFDFF